MKVKVVKIILTIQTVAKRKQETTNELKDSKDDSTEERITQK